MKTILIREPSTEKQTLGKLSLFNESNELLYSCHTLELPWLNNEIRKSCIPIGDYKVVPRYSKKFGNHFHVLGTEPRTWILFHSGNYYTQIEGCILVGEGLADINGDGLLDVTNSKVAMSKLLELAPNGFDLVIETEEEK